MVNFSSNNSKLNKKRGISTIVGGIIFLVLLTAGFSAFFVAMDVQSDTIDAQRTISDSLIDKTQEQFVIAVATDETNNNQLGIHVKNQGPNPVEISNIWIINKSEANQPTKKIEVDYSDAFIAPGYGSSILEHQPLYMIPNDLNPSESTIFSWHTTLKATATVGIKVKFSNFATGTESVTGFAVTSNMASDKIIVRDPQGGSGEEIVIRDELFARPDIFMIIPNNFGDADQQALWGITVANPTDATMYVSKITVSILFAGANDNQKILDSGCVHTNIAPATDHWDCPNQNQLVWYDTTAPYDVQAIPPRSAYTFLVTIKPGVIVGPTEGLD